MTIRFCENISMAEATQLLAGSGCRIVPDMHGGGVVLRPGDPVDETDSIDDWMSAFEDKLPALLRPQAD